MGDLQFWQSWLTSQLDRVPALRVAISSFAKDVRRAPPERVNEIFERARGVVEPLLPSSISTLGEEARSAL